MPDISPDVIAAAQAAQRTYGILASVSLAQWAQESGWGADVTGAFNYFGIKAVAGQSFKMCHTHEYVHGQRVPIMAPFRNFANENEAFAYHAALLATGSAYAAARQVRGDYRAFCNALTGHYATDPNYGAELIRTIQGDNLTRYDLPISGVAPAQTVAAIDPVAATRAAIGDA